MLVLNNNINRVALEFRIGEFLFQQLCFVILRFL